MFMSEMDLPARFAKYDGDHITLKRIALLPSQVRGLPSFPAADKRKDPRFKWFVANHGARVLGTGCDGPERSARLRRAGDQEADRARRVETLRGRQQGRAGIAQNDSENWGAA